jgi:PAS domain S-box-containing protein
MPAKQQLFNTRDKKFKLLFEENPQPMWVFDAENQKFLEVNGAAAALYGYSVEDFRTMSLSDVQVPEDARRFAEEVNRPGRTAAGVWRHRTKTNRLIEVEIAVHEIQYGGRKARLAVLLDITGRRQLEEQLRQAQKMEAVGMLAGGVAHDFNNLLTIISGYSELILRNLAPNDPNRNLAEQIMKAGDRAAALTRQLLAFSRRQVLQPKVLELNKLVTSLSTMLRRLIGEDVELRLVLSPDLGRVSADPGQLEQVLMNLAVNARDAMPKGGILTIETTNLELDENYAGRHISVKSGPYIQLAVSDTGTGMDEATKARLFEPFFTTKGTGTGLGLSTVFGIIKQSGGSVDVYSEPGHGTSVKVYLPRIDQAAAAPPEDQQTKSVRGSETILVAEDDEMVRTLVRTTLERDGYKVLESADPVEARRVAERHKGTIHLLISDVVMPKLSGRELAEQIVQRRPGMKVLYMSGYTDNAVLNSGILHQTVAFLQKPFTPAALTEKVREVLEGTGKTQTAVE